jgi:hypothetical protein
LNKPRETARTSKDWKRKRKKIHRECEVFKGPDGSCPLRIPTVLHQSLSRVAEDFRKHKPAKEVHEVLSTPQLVSARQ